MLKSLLSLVAVSASFAGVSAFPALPELGDLLTPRASTSSNFSLFAYGSASDTTIGGYPIFYYNHLAYIVNPAVLNYTQSYVVFEANNTEWVANPLTVSTASWEKSLLYIPVGSGPVGFYTEGSSNVSTSDIITTGFKAYGSTAMVSIDGTFYTEWYAVPTNTTGLWYLGWNATGGGVENAELVSLRKGKAANVVYPDLKE